MNHLIELENRLCQETNKLWCSYHDTRCDIVRADCYAKIQGLKIALNIINNYFIMEQYSKKEG